MLVESRMELRIPYRLRGPFILFPSDKFGKDPKKSQDTGGFLKPFGENLTGSFCSGIRGAKDRGAILASRQKGGLFTHYSKMPKAWHRESEQGDSEGEKRSPRITHSHHAHLVKKLRR